MNLPFNPLVVVEQWLADKKVTTKQRAYHTLNKFTQYLATLEGAEWGGRHDDPGSFRAICNAGPDVIRGYYRWLLEQRKTDGNPYAPLHIANLVRRLQDFYSYLVNIDYLVVNPVKKARLKLCARTRRVRPHLALTDDQVRRIMDGISLRHQDGVRDYTALALMFGGGLRCGEVIKLTMGDITETPEGPALFLRDTKSGADVTHRIAPWVAKAVNAWYRVRQLDGASATESFIATNQSTINNQFKFYCRKAGLVGTITTHSARKTAINKMARENVPLPSIMRFSRHKSMNRLIDYIAEVQDPEMNPGINLQYGAQRQRDFGLVNQLVPITRDPDESDVH